MLVDVGGCWWMLVDVGWWVLVGVGGGWWWLVVGGGGWWLVVVGGGCHLPKNNMELNTTHKSLPFLVGDMIKCGGF